MARVTMSLLTFSGAGDVGGIIGVDQHLHVEIAVADVADDGVDQALRFAIGLGGQDAFGQARNRHAAIGGNGAAAGAHLQQGEIRVVARGPQARALFGAAGPFEIAGAVFRRDGLHQLRLLGHAGRRAVEFKQQQWLLRQRHLVVGIDGFDAVFIDDLDARQRNAGLHRLDHGGDGLGDAGKRTRSPAQHRFGNAEQPYRHLGDDAQRALAAHEQPREVVAGRGFLGAGRRADMAAIASTTPRFTTVSRMVP